MQELFIKLVNVLNGCGNIAKADMYEGGKHSCIAVETAEGKYEVFISKVEEDKNA